MTRSTETFRPETLVAIGAVTLSDLDGRPWTIRSDSLVGRANPDLNEEMLDLLAGAIGVT